MRFRNLFSKSQWDEVFQHQHYCHSKLDNALLHGSRKRALLCIVGCLTRSFAKCLLGDQMDHSWEPLQKSQTWNQTSLLVQMSMPSLSGLGTEQRVCKRGRLSPLLTQPGHTCPVQWIGRKDSLTSLTDLPELSSGSEQHSSQCIKAPYPVTK